MSDVIKVNLKGRKIKKVITNEPETSGALVEVNDEETIEKKLRNEFERGFNEGFQKGSEETEKKYEDILFEKNSEFYSILKTFEEKLIDYEQSFTEIVINVSKIIAEKIIKREIEKKSIISQTLKEALSQVIAANKVVVKINPEDLNLIESNEQLGIRFSKITFEPDKTIEKGGCIVETEIGNVDARIKAQMSEIIKALELNLINEEKNDAK